VASTCAEMVLFLGKFQQPQRSIWTERDYVGGELPLGVLSLRAACFGRTMKSLIATIVVIALTVGQAAAAHLERARRHYVEHHGGGPYESVSQGHQSYPNPDRLPYVTQFDEPPQ
jgi:hypothetical protein